MEAYLLQVSYFTIFYWFSYRPITYQNTKIWKNRLKASENLLITIYTHNETRCVPTSINLDEIFVLADWLAWITYYPPRPKHQLHTWKLLRLLVIDKLSKYNALELLGNFEEEFVCVFYLSFFFHFCTVRAFCKKTVRDGKICIDQNCWRIYFYTGNVQQIYDPIICLSTIH